MSKDKTPEDPILDQLFFYLSHAKNLLEDNHKLAPVIFAITPFGTQILPVYHPDGEAAGTLDLISKVMTAYDCTEYYMIADSNRVAHDDQLQECINSLYVSRKLQRLLCWDYGRFRPSKEGTDVIHFEDDPYEVAELDKIGGSINKLFSLLDHTPMEDQEKEHLRMMFPILDAEEMIEFKNQEHLC